MSFHVLIYHLDIHFGELSAHIFCPFTNWIVYVFYCLVWELFIYSRLIFFFVIGVFWQFNYDAPLWFSSCFFCLGSVQLLRFVGFSFMKLEKILTIVSLNICSAPLFFPGALITYILDVSYCPRALLDFFGIFFHLCFSLDIS